jgi:hypothetical protein
MFHGRLTRAIKGMPGRSCRRKGTSELGRNIDISMDARNGSSNQVAPFMKHARASLEGVSYLFDRRRRSTLGSAEDQRY